MNNIVYIATSIDGYIADKDGNIDWLYIVENPDKDDLGWSEFIKNIDAIVMGKNTFEKILSFNMGWHYQKPVFILSNSMKEIPEGFTDKIEIISGTPQEVTELLHNKGFNNIYVDGGTTVQQFLKEDLIEELIITKIPILLGGGIPLFKELDNQMVFELVETKIMINHLVQIKYKRKR